MAQLKHPIAEYMRERALSNEGQLKALISTFQQMVQARRYDAAKHIEYAILAFRREELDDFVCELEQHERERNKAPPPSEPEGRQP